MRTQTAHVTVEGLANIPPDGPVLLVARHFHHLLDGAVLVRNIPRPIHIVVGLDWVADARQRRWMERACRAAEYPIVLRAAALRESAAYERADLVRYTRAALRETTRLLRDGRVVLVFPEAFPTIDPTSTRKMSTDAWLPFEPGILKMLDLAQRDGTTDVTVIPIGFSYVRSGRWSIAARIGAPLATSGRTVAAIQDAVQRLSQPDLLHAPRTG